MSFLSTPAGASFSRIYSNTIGLGLFTPTSSQVTLSWNGSPMFALMCSSAHASAFVTATSRYRLPSASSASTVSGNGGHERMESLKLSASSSLNPTPQPDAISRWMRGSISVKGFSGIFLWYSYSAAAKAIRISSSVFDTSCRPNVGRNHSKIPDSKSISVPTTSNVSVLKSRSLISSPPRSSRGGYDGTRILTRQDCATPATRFPQDERNFRELRKAEVQLAEFLFHAHR